MEQIQVVQEAFNGERSEYEKEISELKVKVESVDRTQDTAVDDLELERLREERGNAFNERDNAQLEKNKV